MAEKQLDMLRGSLWRGIPLFALPVAATGILEQMSNLMGTVIVGSFSADAAVDMAAVGSNTPIANLLIYLFLGLSIGVNVVVAQAVGRGDRAEVHRCVQTSVALAVVGIAVTIVMELASRPLLVALSVPADTLPKALLYLRVYLLGMPAVLLYNLEAAIFRSVGITQMPLNALALSTVLNVILDLVFVPVLGWGPAGVAAASVICYAFSAAYLFVRLTRERGLIGLDLRDLGIDGRVAMKIMRIGLPAGLQSSVFGIANLVIQSAINSLGTQVLAASSASVAIEVVCYSLLNSFSQACTTFVGQNYGARNVARCKSILIVCLVEGSAITLLLMAAMLVSGRSMLALFVDDPEILQIAHLRLTFIFGSYLFSLIYENVSGYLRGFGISLAPALLTMLSVCGLRLFWVFVIFPKSPTFATIMASYPVSLAITCVLMFIVLAACRPASHCDAA